MANEKNKLPDNKNNLIPPTPSSSSSKPDFIPSTITSTSSSSSPSSKPDFIPSTITSTSSSSSPSSRRNTPSNSTTSELTPEDITEIINSKNKIEALSSEISKRIKDVENDSNKKLLDFKNEVKKSINDETAKFKDQLTPIQSQINNLNDDKIKIIETIGIFVSIFTFVSAEFSILKNSTAYTSIPLTLVLVGSIILIHTLIHFVLNDFDSKIIKSKLTIMIAIATVSISVGIFLLFKFEGKLDKTNTNEKPSNNNNAIIIQSTSSATVD